MPRVSAFRLAAESRSQAQVTLVAWPWSWVARRQDPPWQRRRSATRLRRELEFAAGSEPWQAALAALQDGAPCPARWRAPGNERHWRGAFALGSSFGLPPLVALLAGANIRWRWRAAPSFPSATAPAGQWLLLVERLEQASCRGSTGAWSPSRCRGAASGGGHPSGGGPGPGRRQRPPPTPAALVARWRHSLRLGPDGGGFCLRPQGSPPGPELGERLRTRGAERLRSRTGFRASRPRR